MRQREDSRQLGRVEIDDAYLGGERSGGKSGRGSENKVPFIAAVQTTDDGHPLYACFARQPFTTEAVAIWAAKSLATSAQVVSDGLWCFRGVTIIGAEHKPIVTGRAGAKLAQFKAVSTLLGNLKTALTGTYHAFDFAKYAHRYLAEAQYRFNRRFNLASILARLLRAASITPPRSAPLIQPRMSSAQSDNAAVTQDRTKGFRKIPTPNQPMQRTRSGGLRPPARAADGRRSAVM